LITAWRICKTKLAFRAFDGRGAAEFPGRWNPPGVRAVYTSENRSLAQLEVLANAEDRELLTAAAWTIIPVRFDIDSLHAPEKFPDDWRQVPAPDSTRRFGGDWMKKGVSPVLRVPSVVTLGEFNYVLNPIHPEFRRLTIGPPEAFTFDARVK
jgi:RES domain-containing protein